MGWGWGKPKALSSFIQVRLYRVGRVRQMWERDRDEEEEED